MYPEGSTMTPGPVDGGSSRRRRKRSTNSSPKNSRNRSSSAGGASLRGMALTFTTAGVTRSATLANASSRARSTAWGPASGASRRPAHAATVMRDMVTRTRRGCMRYQKILKGSEADLGQQRHAGYVEDTPPEMDGRGDADPDEVAADVERDTVEPERSPRRWSREHAAQAAMCPRAQRPTVTEAHGALAEDVGRNQRRQPGQRRASEYERVAVDGGQAPERVPGNALQCVHGLAGFASDASQPRRKIPGVRGGAKRKEGVAGPVPQEPESTIRGILDPAEADGGEMRGQLRATKIEQRAGGAAARP